MSMPRHSRLAAARKGQGPLDPRRSIGKVPKRAIDKASSYPCSGAESQNNAALALRVAALRKVKEAEEAKNAFPVALRLPHPELVAGKEVTFGAVNWVVGLSENHACALVAVCNICRSHLPPPRFPAGAADRAARAAAKEWT